MSKIQDAVPWFALAGSYDDVVISTRALLIRNLADFPFPVKMNEDDRQRVKSLVYDAFSPDESFHFLDFSSISSPGREILKDKNIIKNTKDFSCDAVVLNDDDCTSCIVNESDHIRISSFVAGLETEKAMEKVYKLDEYLQAKLQFAASYEFGYLTSHIRDCGTGMKLSLRIFIPSIVLSGAFKDIDSLLESRHFYIKPVCKVGDTADFSNCLFDVYPVSNAEGTEFDQMAAIQSIGMLILKTERKIRREFADNNPTIVLNFVKRAWAKAMYSLLLSYEDCVDIILSIKWGLQTGFISGILECDLNALLYRTKNGHLMYLSDNYVFSFEEDVKSDQKTQIQRLRAIVIQQAFENIKIK